MEILLETDLIYREYAIFKKIQNINNAKENYYYTDENCESIEV